MSSMQASLELDMLPKSTGEAAMSPAMSAAYSPISSPKTSSHGDRTSARGESQSLLGPKTSSRGDSQRIPAVKAAIMGTSQSDMSNDEPSSARIGAWPAHGQGETPCLNAAA